MLYHKEGFPEEGEIVLCTVTSVQFNSVFVELDEYGRTGMIHISEVSPGRIRNLRDYVVEGKVIACKVLKIHRDRGHIDLSLRRVTEGQRRRKVNKLKKDEVCEKILDFVAKGTKKNIKEIYKHIISKTQDQYDGLSDIFYEIVKDEFDIKKLGLEKKVEDMLDETIRQRIKPELVEIKGDFMLISYAPDGVEIIKEALKKGEKIPGDFTLKYIGAGKYGLELTAEDYKSAEDTVSKITKAVMDHVTSKGGEASFKRRDKKSS